jgi:hypothetical protein
LEPVESVEFYAVPLPGSASASAGSAGSATVGSAASLLPGSHVPASSGSSSSLAVSPEPPGWNAVYYDSPRSLAPKLLLADERRLAGAGFWAIGYERGLPGYSELIATFRAGDLQAP